MIQEMFWGVLGLSIFHGAKMILYKILSTK